MKKIVIALAFTLTLVMSLQVSAEDLFSTPCKVTLNDSDNVTEGAFIISAQSDGVSVKIKGLALSSEITVPTDKLDNMIASLKKAHKWTDIIAKAGKNVAPKSMFEFTKPQSFGDPAGVGFSFFAIDNGTHCGVIATVIGDKNNFVKLNAGLSIDDIDAIVNALEQKARAAIKREQDAIDAGDLLN